MIKGGPKRQKQKLNTMNKKEFNYVSPAAIVKEIQAEGMLCVSALQGVAFTIKPWEEDSFTW